MIASILHWLYPADFDAGNIAVQDDGAGAFISHWNVAGVPQPTPAEVLAQLPVFTAAGGAQIFKRRRAKGVIDEQGANGKMLRAILLTILDEINILRAQHGLPPRTPQQARTAIANKIDAGTADS